MESPRPAGMFADPKMTIETPPSRHECHLLRGLEKMGGLFHRARKQYHKDAIIAICTPFNAVCLVPCFISKRQKPPAPIETGGFPLFGM